MPSLETYRKQAKRLLRWHQEENYSVGEKVRQLDRFRTLTDRQALSMKLTLALAQEIIAVEAGFMNWSELKAATAEAPKKPPSPRGAPVLKNTVPILFVRDVTDCAAFFEQKLGFKIDFLHGSPPFYGAVSRDQVCIHLRHVHRPLFARMAAEERSLILASIEVANVHGLFEEYKAKGVPFVQSPTKQAWGGTDFHVRDPDGNVISFVTYG